MFVLVVEVVQVMHGDGVPLPTSITIPVDRIDFPGDTMQNDSRGRGRARCLACLYASSSSIELVWDGEAPVSGMYYGGQGIAGLRAGQSGSHC